MKFLQYALISILGFTAMSYSQSSSAIEPELAERFATLALDCVHREYPNKISHVLASDADAKPPSELTPAFYGCYDWHSAVHGHWLLTRLLHLTPEAEFADRARTALSHSFTEDNIRTEVEYYVTEGRRSFERPYGIAWFLQLTSELREWDDPDAKNWLKYLQPLEAAIVSQIKDWLPKLAYPIRLGTHNQSAFAFGLMLDWARTAGDKELEELIIDKSKAFHAGDVNCPLAYEPSGEDFLSPCLMEADLMRRIYSQAEFNQWLSRFLPQIPTDGSTQWLAVGIVNDPTDGKLVHLDGVNLSRAWNLKNIAAALPSGDSRIASLQATAEAHQESGVASVSDEHYSGSHWLASFATYLVTDRGR